MRANISINLDVEDAKEAERLIEAMKANFKMLSGDKRRCTKGKAFLYLLRKGAAEYEKMIEEKITFLKTQKKKLEAVQE